MEDYFINKHAKHICKIIIKADNHTKLKLRKDVLPVEAERRKRNYSLAEASDQ